MRRRSLSPPRAGVTHSRYSPSWTRTVSPGSARAAAALIVRSGALAEPSALSEPGGGAGGRGRRRARGAVGGVRAGGGDVVHGHRAGVSPCAGGRSEYISRTPRHSSPHSGSTPPCLVLNGIRNPSGGIGSHHPPVRSVVGKPT